MVNQKFCPSCGCWSLVEGGYPQDGVWACSECDQIWTEVGLEAHYASMNLNKKNELIVYKYRLASPLPPFIQFGHRHFVKEIPSGIVNGKEERFTLPVDLLSVVGIPAHLIEEIESIQLVYQRKGGT